MLKAEQLPARVFYINVTVVANRKLNDNGWRGEKLGPVAALTCPLTLSRLTEGSRTPRSTTDPTVTLGRDVAPQMQSRLGPPVQRLTSFPSRRRTLGLPPLLSSWRMLILPQPPVAHACESSPEVTRSWNEATVPPFCVGILASIYSSQTCRA